MENNRERGQSLVEFVLLLPVLLIILAGVLDLGRMYYIWVALTDAAGEGAAYAAISPTDQDETKKRAQEASTGLVTIEPSMIDIEAPTVATGAPITVSVGYTFTLITPFMNVIVPDGQLVLRGRASERILSGSLGGP